MCLIALLRIGLDKIFPFFGPIILFSYSCTFCPLFFSQQQLFFILSPIILTFGVIKRHNKTSLRKNKTVINFLRCNISYRSCMTVFKEEFCCSKTENFKIENTLFWQLQMTAELRGPFSRLWPSVMPTSYIVSIN